MSKETAFLGRLKNDDLRNILMNTGRVLTVMGLCMFLPFLISVLSREWPSAINFFIMGSVTTGIGNFLVHLMRTGSKPTWNQGFVIVAFIWLVAMLFGAIPLHMSGHYESYLDACFESMSGFTTTGLTMVQDLDHMSYGVNFWRHLMMFLGGQGIVVLVIAYFVSGSSFAAQLYVGEGKESIMPNVVESSRFIWKISAIYFAIGTTALSVALLVEGVELRRALFHASCIFMAGFDTGGFAPMSLGIMYYRSYLIEIITIGLMITGATNFAVQYEVLSGRWRESYRNLEIRVMATSVTALLFVVVTGLTISNAYSGLGESIRRGFYQLFSAQSGTGFMTIYTNEMEVAWGDAAVFAIMIAMIIGGCSCSTSGAIKLFRIGFLFKEISLRLKKVFTPGSAVIKEKVHNVKDFYLEPSMTGSAFLFVCLYVSLAVAGALIGMLCGYGMDSALFESVSATGNTGLSMGVATHTAPVIMKLMFIFQMWAGRLEILAIMAMILYFAGLPFRRVR